MARPGARQVAGYYKTPSALLPSFASTLNLPERGAILLDPCAGDGEAITTLQRLWCPARSDLPDWKQPHASIVACELEAQRAAQLADRLDRYHEAHHGDAMNLRPLSADGVTVCYLNPPYDFDKKHGRLEQRFLTRFTRFIYPGHGYLMFLVPHYALEASADYLARNYLEIEAWRLPAEHFAAFKQVLLIARRAKRRIHAPDTAETIRGWARETMRLDELPWSCPSPRRIDVLPDGRQYNIAFTMEAIDATAMLERFDAWRDLETGTEQSAADLLGVVLPTAVPPRPAHIAIALSAGMFNGKRLEPNDPDKHPEILAKGVFQRELVEIAEKRDAEGELIGTINVERPVLVLTVLRLDNCAFHTLRSGTVPTGSEDLANWNTADLIQHYDASLAEVMTEQFPPLHDPKDPSQRLTLPALPRTPFEAQHDAIQASLKLIAEGRNPQLLAEVGTGKTTMALYIAAALSPEHCAATKRGLDRLGFETDRLPRARRTLVVCPPHLLESWQCEARAVNPDARVQVIEGPKNLGEDADIYLLSRERAKLGHAFVGVEKTCPRCGQPTEKSAKQNASRRLCCLIEHREPRNVAAYLVRDLAAILASTPARNEVVDDLISNSPVLRRVAARPARPIRRKPLRRFLVTLMKAIERWLEADLATSRYRLVRPLRAAEQVATVIDARDDLTGARADLANTLDRLLETQEGQSYGPISQVREARANLDLEPEDEADHHRLQNALEALDGEAEWTKGRVCGEPLYQAVPRPRRFPIATLIARRYRHRFDLLIVDESHEYNHDRSAQSKALHRLAGLPGITTVLLTGSLMGGYASALFPNAWTTNHDLRAEFGRGDRLEFVKRFGFAKVLDAETPKRKKKERGAFTDREIQGRRVGEAPGIHPEYITRYLLPSTVILHKSDLDVELPTLTEDPCPIACTETETDAELLAEYSRLQTNVLERIRQEQFDPDRAGKLLGALVELPSYLDRCTSDLGVYEIVYPAVGDEPSFILDTGRVFPRNYRTPKERFLLSKLKERLGAGEHTLVFLRHTGSAALPKRLLRLIKRHVTSSCAWLDAKKVPTAKRQQWIEKNVVDKGARVLIVNPNAVRTGLNCLTRFSSAIWHQLDYSATTYRQANGRIHRIGQKRPVWVGTPFIVGTAQQIAFDLVASKVSASLQVDGLDLETALEAAGASEAEAGARAATMSLGEAIYRRLVAAA